MGYWLIGVTGLCILIVVLVSRLYTQRHIDTLHEAYQRERQFIHHASHELNNPLTAIQGECEIALLKKRDAADLRGVTQQDRGGEPENVTDDQATVVSVYGHE